MKRVRLVLVLSLAFIMLFPTAIFADTGFKIPDAFKPGTMPKVDLKNFEMKPSKEMPPLNFDGSQSEWAEDEIEEAYKYGLTYAGVEGDYKKQITREEFATIAVKLYEKLSGKTATPAANPFTDTSNPEILKAYNIGIVKGTSATEFSPSKNITRQEICAMIKRALKGSYPNLKTTFSGDFPFVDAHKIASWALEDVKYAYQHDIMQGTSANTISPLSNTTREQAIALLKRTYVKGSSNGLPREIDKSMLAIIEKNKIYPSKNFGAIGKNQISNITKVPPYIDYKGLPWFIDKNKTEPGEAPGFPLTANDAGIRGVDWLGKGVNIITDKYAENVKNYHILDSKKLLQDGRIYYQLNDNSSSRYIAGQDAWTYSESLSTSVKTGGKYLCFGGSVSAKFSSTHLQEKNRSFATLMYRAPKYDLYIDDLSINLKNYLTDSFKKNIETMDAKQLFDLYGTHMLRSVIMGGRVEYNATTDSQYQSKSNNMELDVKASFNAIFASANIGVEASQSQASTSYREHSDTNIQAYPSFGSPQLDPKSFDKWYNAMCVNPGMCDYGDNPLIPIWELADGARSKYLEKEYHEYAKSKNYLPSQVTFGINGIRIQRFGLYEHHPQKYVDPKTNDEWELVGNVRATSHHYSNPEVALVYVRKGFSNDVSKPPIVGLIIANHTKGDNPWEMFDKAYGNDPDAKLWGAYPKNMEPDSGLEYYVNEWVSLHYVTSRNKPQMTALRVRNDSNCPGGKTTFYPDDTANDPDFLPVLNINTGKRQNLAENEPDRVSVQKNRIIMGFPAGTKTVTYCVNKEYYLEYKK
ncbi:MAG: S-layer homology domain-containing protein [Anaerovoracaceae bacterium]|jgi:hypothetical protein